MILRPRQKVFVERAVRALGEHGNTLGVAPTGAGKTIMLSGCRRFEFAFVHGAINLVKLASCVEHMVRANLYQLIESGRSCRKRSNSGKGIFWGPVEELLEPSLVLFAV